MTYYTVIKYYTVKNNMDESHRCNNEKKQAITKEYSA